MSISMEVMSLSYNIYVYSFSLYSNYKLLPDNSDLMLKRPNVMFYLSGLWFFSPYHVILQHKRDHKLFSGMISPPNNLLLHIHTMNIKSTMNISKANKYWKFCRFSKLVVTPTFWFRKCFSCKWKKFNEFTRRNKQIHIISANFKKFLSCIDKNIL